MANVSFTRDEAILALDVLYSTGERPLRGNDEEIIALSKLLNELPLFPDEKKQGTFRDPSGVCHQINGFRLSFYKGVKNGNVGQIFYDMASTYTPDEIHAIATAIYRNADFLCKSGFENYADYNEFPESGLLNFLHREIENRDGRLFELSDRCDICQLNLSQVYKPVAGKYLQAHLLIPITDLNWKIKYSAVRFITVCPNCHSIIHKYRPWVKRESILDILK